MELVLIKKGDIVSDRRDVYVKNKVEVETEGGPFKFFVALMLISMAVNMAASRRQLEEANELRKQELEVAKKQYALDSLRYYTPQQKQK